MAICPNCQTKTGDLLAPCPSGDGFFCIDDKEFASYPDDPLLGRQVADRFIIMSVLGRGSMGHVYKGRQEQVDRSVALKVFRPENLPGSSLGLKADDDARRTAQGRFVQEARVLGKLSHPNCVTLYDFGVSEDKQGEFLYIAMEHVAGISLRRAIHRGLKFDAVVEIARQILHALREAHALNIVHRDLKPENIILSFRPSSEEQIVKVLDFGIAKLLQQDTESFSAAGLLFGTPAYMSPEQCRGEVDGIGPATDIYALGCILYEMVCGHLPYESQFPQEMVRLHQSAEIPPVVERSGLKVPGAFKAFIKRCLAKEPGERFPSARAALRVFEESLEADDASKIEELKWRNDETAETGLRRVVVPQDHLRGEEMDVSAAAGKDAVAAPAATASIPQEQRSRLRVSETVVGEPLSLEAAERKAPPKRVSTTNSVRAALVVMAFLVVAGFCALLFYYIYLMIMSG